MASLVWLTVEDDRESKVQSVVQSDNAQIVHRPFHDHAISPRTTRETDTDRTTEDRDLKQQLNEFAERCEGFRTAVLVLSG